MMINKVEIDKLFECLKGDRVDVNSILEFVTMDLNLDVKRFTNSLESEIVTKLDIIDLLDFLKNKAISLTNLDNFFDGFNNLNWRFVASRLSLLSIYYRASITRGDGVLGYSNYYEFVERAVMNGIYDEKILKIYTKEELLEISKERTMSYDFEFDLSSLNLLERRYLMKLNSNIFEQPQDMYLTIALLFASTEKKEIRLEKAKEFYHAIGKRIISPATPIMLNLRRVNGNLASCFITAMDDSLTSIYYTLDQVAQISKNAGGVGVNMSRVRSSGSYIKNIKGASGGVSPWIKLINDTAVAVNQLGSRSGAVTVALDIWHKDVLNFLELQTENGDHRRKAFDVFPQLVICDEFMRRVEQNRDWTLFDPKEIRDKFKIELCELYGEKFEETYKMLEENDIIELKETINAKILFKQFLKTLVETGMPYVAFKDTINNLNPNKNSGMIGNVNLCTESFSNFSPSKVEDKTFSNGEINQKILPSHVHTCNLISLNLAEFENDKKFIQKYSKIATRMLDNAIELTKTPLPESEKHNDEYRIVGVGALGLADFLAREGICYTKSKEIVDNLFENVALGCVCESIDMAEERGAYKYYKGSDFEKGIYFGKTAKELGDEWIKLDEKRQKVGIRNGGLLAIAPNTSTSLLVGATASVLPIYKKFFVDKSSSGAIPVVPPQLNSKTFWIYKENQNIDQKIVIDITSTIQKWIDQGISMELVLNLKNGLKAKDIYELYMESWKKKCKTVYYARSIVQNTHQETKLDENKMTNNKDMNLNQRREKDECISCAN